MAEEEAELPDELERWLEDRAEETDRDRAEVLARAVTAYRLLSAHGDELTAHDGPVLDDDDVAAAFDSDLSTLSATVDELDARVNDLESTHESDIEDVRSRVVQVMQAAQAKADEDHAHEEYEQRITGLATDVDDLSEALDDLESYVSDGFDNYETVLVRLKETTDDLDDKVTRLAGAVVDLRRRVTDLEAADARRSAVEELQTEANRHGIATASCADCGSSVDISLLARPHCPHCGAVFDGVESARGFFGSSTLTVGERPALEGESFEPESPEAALEGEAPTEAESSEESATETEAEREEEPAASEAGPDTTTEAESEADTTESEAEAEDGAKADTEAETVADPENDE